MRTGTCSDGVAAAADATSATPQSAQNFALGTFPNRFLYIGSARDCHTRHKIFHQRLLLSRISSSACLLVTSWNNAHLYHLSPPKNEFEGRAAHHLEDALAHRT